MIILDDFNAMIGKEIVEVFDINNFVIFFLSVEDDIEVLILSIDKYTSYISGDEMENIQILLDNDNIRNYIENLPNGEYIISKLNKREEELRKVMEEELKEIADESVKQHLETLVRKHGKEKINDILGGM
jgi:hypothetical protein